MDSSALQCQTDQITSIGSKIFWLQMSSLLPGMTVMLLKVLILALAQIVFIPFLVHPFLVGSLLVQVIFSSPLIRHSILFRVRLDELIKKEAAEVAFEKELLFTFYGYFCLFFCFFKLIQMLKTCKSVFPESRS